jgi:hypothetical protein
MKLGSRVLQEHPIPESSAMASMTLPRHWFDKLCSRGSAAAQSTARLISRAAMERLNKTYQSRALCRGNPKHLLYISIDFTLLGVSIFVGALIHNFDGQFSERREPPKPLLAEHAKRVNTMKGIPQKHYTNSHCN